MSLYISIYEYKLETLFALFSIIMKLNCLVHDFTKPVFSPAKLIDCCFCPLEKKSGCFVLNEVDTRMRHSEVIFNGVF